MKPSKTKDNLLSFGFLLLGSGLYALITWKWNVPAAAWLAPVFLIRFFRRQERWPLTLLAVPLLWGASYANKFGAWGMDPLLEVTLLGIAALPMLAALYLDRFAAQRLHGLSLTLVFPAAYVALDYALSFLPIGTSLSLAPSQYYLSSLVQVAALTGVWGISFLVLWAAPLINAWWEAGFASHPVRLELAVYALCLVAVLLYGGLRLVFTRPESSTVRVAGVAVEHPRLYWDELIDLGTPQDKAQALTAELQTLEDRLFAESEIAANSGAKIIVWSEANAILLPERKEAFIQRARNFARRRQVYLAPAYQVLRYGDTSGDNQLVLITPSGEVAYTYTKTMTWYATDSDGIIHSVDTPYGRIGAAICFDLDFPYFIRQAAQQGVDIMLVPAFDTYETRVYHTEVGLLRGIEDGFSMIRMVNDGTSMAVDYRGRLLAAQDFYTTPSRILFADLPTRRAATLYGQLGDWFAWLCIAISVGLLAASALRRPVQLMPGQTPRSPAGRPAAD